MVLHITYYELRIRCPIQKALAISQCSHPMRRSMLYLQKALFAQASRLARTFAQIIKLRPAYFGFAEHLNFFHILAVEWKGALDANTMSGGTPHGVGCTRPFAPP